MKIFLSALCLHARAELDETCGGGDLCLIQRKSNISKSLLNEDDNVTTDFGTPFVQSSVSLFGLDGATGVYFSVGHLLGIVSLVLLTSFGVVAGGSGGLIVAFSNSVFFTPSFAMAYGSFATVASYLVAGCLFLRYYGRASFNMDIALCLGPACWIGIYAGVWLHHQFHSATTMILMGSIILAASYYLMSKGFVIKSAEGRGVRSKIRTEGGPGLWATLIFALAYKFHLWCLALSSVDAFKPWAMIVDFVSMIGLVGVWCWWRDTSNERMKPRPIIFFVAFLIGVSDGLVGSESIWRGILMLELGLTPFEMATTNLLLNIFSDITKSFQYALREHIHFYTSTCFIMIGALGGYIGFKVMDKYVLARSSQSTIVILLACVGIMSSASLYLAAAVKHEGATL